MRYLREKRTRLQAERRRRQGRPVLQGLHTDSRRNPEGMKMGILSKIDIGDWIDKHEVSSRRPYRWKNRAGLLSLLQERSKYLGAMGIVTIHQELQAIAESYLFRANIREDAMFADYGMYWLYFGPNVEFPRLTKAQFKRLLRDANSKTCTTGVQSTLEA